MSTAELPLVWHRVADPDALEDGRVRTVQAGHRSIALTRIDGRYGALDNHCPHQGGPLGEGSIEKGLLRCPWHGYDYDPLTGSPPPPFTDAPSCFPVQLREDGIYVGLAPETPHVRTVSDLMVETMVAWGITHVFGMVGHSNLGFAEAMRRAEERGQLTFVGIRHEGAAAFAASAYGKLTGRPCACFAIAGPGSTNLLTGLYDAKVDRAPVLAISGQVPSKVLGRGAFQDVDLAGAFSDVATFSRTVHAGSDHAEMMTLAIKHALVERGVGHLVLPDEVQDLPAREGVPASGPAGRLADAAIAPPPAALEAALALLREARRPVIVVGHGARFHMDPVRDLAEALGAPVITTFKAKGLIADDHPLAGGVLGRSGTPVASWLMNESDLLLVMGASFANHTGIAPYKPIVQVDADPMAAGRFHPVTVPVLGDVGVAAGLLRDGVADGSAAVDQRPDVAERWAIWRAEKRRRAADDAGGGVSSAAVFDALSRLAPDDAVIAVDVGNNTYSFGRYFECRRQPVLMSGYLGSIGFGLPAAMGAWAAVQAEGSGRKVLAVAGDGGLGQYLAELTTAVKHGMDITLVLLNNGQLGKISKEQRAAELAVWQTSLHNPDFAAFARLCGAWGRRVERPEELDEAIAEGLAHPGTALVEVVADPDLV
ncbi:MAG: pyruvate oxidase [Miltoncostaeaceae bacterium]|jgi:thiamine pyrophosphate-dependent acetolactate synthase large subunit-like protein/nitrite reductase/ring-hydroxylating ferredoxin subunit|nr:pyruvate oxidase [Miltoncostaeaceae bacterium]